MIPNLMFSEVCQTMLGMFEEAIAHDEHAYGDVSVIEFCECFTAFSGNFHNLREVVRSCLHFLYWVCDGGSRHGLFGMAASYQCPYCIEQVKRKHTCTHAV